MGEWTGKRVKFIKSHHLMAPSLIKKVGEKGWVATESETLKEALVCFDDSNDSHYGKYWIKFFRLERIEQ